METVSSKPTQANARAYLRYALLAILSFVLALVIPVLIAIAFTSGPIPVPQVGPFTGTDILWLLLFLFVLAIFHALALLPMRIARSFRPKTRGIFYFSLSVGGYFLLLGAAFLELAMPAAFLLPFWGSFILPALDYYLRKNAL